MFVEQDAATPTLKSVVALLKLGDWDPDVFYKFRDTILNQVCRLLGGPWFDEHAQEIGQELVIFVDTNKPSRDFHRSTLLPPLLQVGALIRRRPDPIRT